MICKEEVFKKHSDLYRQVAVLGKGATGILIPDVVN